MPMVAPAGFTWQELFLVVFVQMGCLGLKPCHLHPRQVPFYTSLSLQIVCLHFSYWLRCLNHYTIIWNVHRIRSWHIGVGKVNIYFANKLYWNKTCFFFYYLCYFYGINNSLVIVTKNVGLQITILIFTSESFFCNIC